MNAEKWHHSEICIAINDESQGSIAKNFRCDELLYYTFIIRCAGERIFKIGEHLAKLRAESLTVSYTPIALHFCPQRCRSRQISWITCVLQTETVIKRCYMLTARLMWVNFQEISNCCRPVLTYWLTDLIHQWLADCRSFIGHSATTFFSFLQKLCTVDNWIFLHGWCKHHFVNELNNEYFAKQYFETVFWIVKSYVAVCSNYFLSIAIFWT